MICMKKGWNGIKKENVSFNLRGFHKYVNMVRQIKRAEERNMEVQGWLSLLVPCKSGSLNRAEGTTQRNLESNGRWSCWAFFSDSIIEEFWRLGTSALEMSKCLFWDVTDQWKRIIYMSSHSYFVSSFSVDQYFPVSNPCYLFLMVFPWVTGKINAIWRNYISAFFICVIIHSFNHFCEYAW